MKLFPLKRRRRRQAPRKRLAALFEKLRLRALAFVAVTERELRAAGLDGEKIDAVRLRVDRFRDYQRKWTAKLDEIYETL